MQKSLPRHAAPRHLGLIVVSAVISVALCSACEAQTSAPGTTAASPVAAQSVPPAVTAPVISLPVTPSQSQVEAASPRQILDWATRCAQFESGTFCLELGWMKDPRDAVSRRNASFREAAQIRREVAAHDTDALADRGLDSSGSGGGDIGLVKLAERWAAMTPTERAAHDKAQFDGAIAMAGDVVASEL